MEEENINIIDNIIQAVSLLNKTDDYLESLGNRLSECEKMNNSFYHFIETTPIENVNLKALYQHMQSNLLERRKVKVDLTIRQTLNNNIAKLNNITNREFLISDLKKVKSKYNEKFAEYENENLSKEILESILIGKTKRRGRPKKVKEGV